MQLVDEYGTYKVWRPHTMLMRQESRWRRGDPELQELAHRLVREPSNRDAMVSLVDATGATGLSDELVAERFAERVGAGSLMMQPVRPVFQGDQTPRAEPLLPVDLSSPGPLPAIEPLQAPGPMAAASSASTSTLFGPPTPSELGIAGNSISDLARQAELRSLIDFYMQPRIREDVRQRVWQDLREDPNKVTVINSMIGETEVLPTPEELKSANQLAGKAHSDIRDMLENLARSGRTLMRGR